MDSTTSVSASLSPEANDSSQSQRVSAPYGHACVNCVKAKCKCIRINRSGTGAGTADGDGTEICERCSRLGKDCKPSPSVRKTRAAIRKPAPIPASSSVINASQDRISVAEADGRGPRGGTVKRSAKLEQKLDDLVAILTAHVQGGSTVAAAAGLTGLPPPYQEETTIGGQDANTNNDRIGPDNVDRRNPSDNTPAPVSRLNTNGIARTDALTPAPSSTSGSTTRGADILTELYANKRARTYSPPISSCESSTLSTSRPSSPVLDLTGLPTLSHSEAEEILTLFRDSYLRFFPFMYIPPGMSAAQLQRDRPYLWLNIRTLCCKSSTQKASMGLRCREILAKQMLVDSERTVDLLLGTVVFLGWAMHHFNGKPYLVGVMNMAISLVNDLRLDRAPHDNIRQENHIFKGYAYPKLTANPTATRTNEEKRAVLSCFAICSGISTFLRCQHMRWTPYMEDALQELATHPEWEGDEVLAVIVQTYKVQEDVNNVTWRSSWSVASDLDAPPPPAIIYNRFLRDKVQKIRKGLSPSLVENSVVMCYIYAAEIAVAYMLLSELETVFCYGASANANNTNSSNQNSHNQTNSSHDNGNQTPNNSNPQNSLSSADLSRMTTYWSSLEASRSCLETFNSFTAHDFVGFSFPMVLNYGRSTLVMYRILLMASEQEDWDRDLIARYGMDLIRAIERGSKGYGSVAETYGLEDGEDFYTKCATAMRAALPRWMSAIEGGSMDPGAGLVAGIQALHGNSLAHLNSRKRNGNNGEAERIGSIPAPPIPEMYCGGDGSGAALGPDSKGGIGAAFAGSGTGPGMSMHGMGSLGNLALNTSSGGRINNGRVAGGLDPTTMMTSAAGGLPTGATDMIAEAAAGGGGMPGLSGMGMDQMLSIVGFQDFLSMDFFDENLWNDFWRSNDMT